ncbi:aspartate kinase (plasmid) [Nicoliella spurrieriana]|uniref:Aspartokinase n=1 Tax=Nicoliella spurrieriana TaxID=2925830 RepID=A0A976X563_9LACO|nr:aspartate kinase [Nicoliella spurrieriana]UQS86207.1 aspartate kinase [Nicoliella spurrieriana]
MIVAKFGGSSMADADQFKKVRQILNQNPKRRIAVVSAAGKGVNNPVKLTDQLIQIYNLIQAGEDYADQLNEVWHRIETIVNELDLSLSIHEELAAIAQNVQHMTYAELVSRGEYLTAKLLANYLGWPMIDSADFLVLNAGQVDYQQSRQRLLELGKHIEHCVISGFYGVDAENNITLLPRGGGDTSGAVVANLVNANCYENWTDTNGILAVDPRIVANPDKIDVLSYDELQELSYLGVKVFNEEAIQPVRMKQIPIRIMNTNQPQLGGTFVVTNKKNVADASTIAGVAGKQNQVILTVKKYQLSNSVNAIIDLIKVVNAFHFKSTYSLSGDSINFVLSGHIDQSTLDQLVTQIKNDIAPDAISLKTGVAKIAVVSESFYGRPKLVGKMIDLLESNGIRVQQVIQTSTDIKVVFGIANQDYQRAIKCLYQQFFRSSQVDARMIMNY